MIAEWNILFKTGFHLCENDSCNPFSFPYNESLIPMHEAGFYSNSEQTSSSPFLFYSL